MYMPPAGNLGRRRVSEESVRTSVESILARVPPTIPFLLVGDFNARTGSRQSSCALGLDAPRASVDRVVCPRGVWLLETCSALDIVIFNGVVMEQQTLSPTHTCHRANGSSVVDYVCGRELSGSFCVSRTTLCSLSDHSVVISSMPCPLVG